jgi:hypothetical protein
MSERLKAFTTDEIAVLVSRIDLSAKIQKPDEIAERLLEEMLEELEQRDNE